MFTCNFTPPCRGRPTPRALPSFPTRRSSDLRLAILPMDIVAEQHAVELVHVRLVRKHDMAGEIERAVRAPALQHAARDRKSTRLNSSHRCISYAVFCLKKKKKLRHSSTAPRR